MHQNKKRFGEIIHFRFSEVRVTVIGKADKPDELLFYVSVHNNRSEKCNI